MRLDLLLRRGGLGPCDRHAVTEVVAWAIRKPKLHLVSSCGCSGSAASMELARWRDAPGGEIILTACLALCNYDNAAWPRALDLACCWYEWLVLVESAVSTAVHRTVGMASVAAAGQFFLD